MENKTKRIYYLDIMRGLAVLFMIFQHAMIMHEQTQGAGNTILGNIVILLGTAPAAPVFLLIMGIFMAKSKQSTKQQIIRGVKLFLLGFALNILRFVIPAAIAGVSMGESYDVLSLLMDIDIFQAAGLSLIVGALLKRWASNKYIFPAIIITILLISPLLWGIFGDNIFLWSLWGANKNTAFPLFPWVVYPLLGMHLSPYLAKPELDKKVKNGLKIASFVLLILGCTAILFTGQIGDYHRSPIGLHLIIISFIFAYTLLCEFIAKKTIKGKPNKAYKTLFFWSANVTGIYIIQWIIYGWSILLLGMNEFMALGAFIIGVIVTVVTHFLIKIKGIRKLIPKI